MPVSEGEDCEHTNFVPSWLRLFGAARGVDLLHAVVEGSEGRDVRAGAFEGGFIWELAGAELGAHGYYDCACAF